ncbi:MULTISPECIES: metal ABC transporter substrate-binding protein [Thermus]|jgi:zinc transport system substrate-binding protein|uniref:ABC transporter substrate-binding protein n=1 Tax=Thermus brockianus TaxID=56956 RepID=A0A1J0LPS0_THEBO|nr:metal ABC transporter substrate-binding protein [Thermus brockianus]APD08262.1 ABC transporter substrate-binding protein [Thermus brockianus]BDG16401.1 ABC transporter substrate-binding protein [Thermus brockianus]
MWRLWILFLVAPALAQVQVAATTPILQDLARQVGSGRAKVVAVVPPGADPHTFEPTPSVAKALSQSRILFANGLGLEPFLPKLQNLLPRGARVVLLGEGQPGLLCEGGSPQEDHDHGPCDPHLWLDPTYALRYAERIAKELSRLDPGGKATYEANLRRFQKEVERRDQAFKACGLKGVKVVAQHDAFRYFARRYGLIVVGTLSDSGAQEVGSRSFLALLEKAKREGVKLLLAEPQFRGTGLKALAEALGARIALLYTDTLDAKVPTYLALLDHNLKALCP